MNFSNSKFISVYFEHVKYPTTFHVGTKYLTPVHEFRRGVFTPSAKPVLELPDIPIIKIVEFTAKFYPRK